MKGLWLAGLIALAVPAWAQDYRELAGTVVMGERILPVFKSQGQDFLLMIQPQEPGAQVLKSGAAVIVKGLFETVTEPGYPPRLLVRPYQIVLQGRVIEFRKLAEGSVDPWQ